MYLRVIVILLCVIAKQVIFANPFKANFEEDKTISVFFHDDDTGYVLVEGPIENKKSSGVPEQERVFVFFKLSDDAEEAGTCSSLRQAHAQVEGHNIEVIETLFKNLKISNKPLSDKKLFAISTSYKKGIAAGAMIAALHIRDAQSINESADFSFQMEDKNATLTIGDKEINLIQSHSLQKKPLSFGNLCTQFVEVPHSSFEADFNIAPDVLHYMRWHDTAVTVNVVNVLGSFIALGTWCNIHINRHRVNNPHLSSFEMQGYSKLFTLPYAFLLVGYFGLSVYVGEKIFPSNPIVDEGTLKSYHITNTQ